MLIFDSKEIFFMYSTARLDDLRAPRIALVGLYIRLDMVIKNCYNSSMVLRGGKSSYGCIRGAAGFL